MQRIIDIYRVSLSGISKEVWVLAFVTLINKSGMMVLPFLSLYLTKDLDWSISEAGIAAGAYGLGSLFGSLIGGSLIQRFNKYNIMFWSLFLSGILFIVILGLQGKISFPFGVMITSLVASIFSPSVFAAIDDLSTSDNRTRGVSLVRLAMNLGFAVGPLAAALLIANFGYHSLFIVDGITCMGAAFFLKFMIDKSLQKEFTPISESEKIGTPRKDYIFLLFLVFCFFNIFAFAQILSTIPVFYDKAHHLSETQIGLFFTFNGLIIFFVEMPIIKHFEHYKKPLILIASGAALIAVAHFSLILFYGSFLSLFLYTLCISFGEVINFPFISSLAMIRAKGKNMGKYMGLVAFMFSLSFFLGPMIGMYVADHFGFNTLWIIMGSLSLVSCIGFYRLRNIF